LALDIDGDLLGEVAAGDRGRDVGDVAHLGGEVAGHLVDVVGEVFPGRSGERRVGMAAEATLGADLARHTGDFAGESIQLIDHAVDGVLELEDLAAYVDRDLLGEITLGDRGRDLGDVADLGGEVARHVVDVVGEVFPDAGDAFDLRLAAKVPFGTDFAGDAGDLAPKGVELIDHDVDRVLELADLAADVDGFFFGEVALGDGGRDVGDVADLGGQVGGHEVNVVGEILPDAGRAFDLRLAAELALGADLAGHAADLGSERAQLLHHGVDGARGPKELPLQRPAVQLKLHRLEEIALGDRADDPR